MKGVIGIFLCVIGLTVRSQQTVQYTQYVFNYLAINPAMAGTEACVEAKLGYRKQWVDLDGLPKTAFATIGGRIKFNEHTSRDTYHGIAVHFENDVIGAFSTTTGRLAYAYHFPLRRDVSAAVGMYAGFIQKKLDVQKIDSGNNDPLIPGPGQRFMIPDVTPGIFISNKDWFVGYNVRQIVRNKWDMIGSDETRNRWHHMFVGGKRFFPTDELSIIPSAMVKYVGFSKFAMDLNLMFEFHESFDLGVMLRNGDAIGGIVKLRFGNFSLGYSYDHTLSTMRYLSSNTHELIIGISTCPLEQPKNSCPAFN